MDNNSDQRELTVHIWRSEASASDDDLQPDGAWQTWEVPVRNSQTVLDVVTWIQRHRGGSAIASAAVNALCKGAT